MNTILETPSHSLSNSDPNWLIERRSKGIEQFEKLATPTVRDESWRFSRVSKMSTKGYSQVEKANISRFDALNERSNLISQCDGRTVFIDDTISIFEGVSNELTEKGVIFTPILEAIREHPDLMEKYFLKESTELGSQKFFGLHASAVKAGSVIYVPKGVEVVEPIVNYHWTSSERVSVYPHTLIIAEDNAKLSVVDLFFSDNKNNKALNVSVCNIYAGAGAKVFRKVVQNWNQETMSFQLDTTVAERDAQVKNIAINIGANRARFENQTRLEGAGADVKMYSLTVAEKNQEFDQRTFQTHNANNAVSDLLYKNALLDKSRSIFSGLIKVAEGAQQTDAYQTNRNLLLDPRAEANALPGLEILANDVRCSHGATTGNVDEEELFYIMQRGISRRVAMQLMIFGFFEEIIDLIDNEELNENVRKLIHHKFDAKLS